MDVCRATKASGDPCKAPATGLHGYCWAHDPANAERRSRMASKAARSKPSRELAGIKQRLWDLPNDVLEGRQDRGVAAVSSQSLNVYLRAVSVELKVREQQEL